MSKSRAIKRAAALAAASCILAACAGTPRPIVDTQGTDPDQYRADLAACELYGDEVDIAGAVVRSAVVGAAIGAAMGAVLGDAGPAAGWGAIGGGSGAGLEDARVRQTVVKQCLRGRGYQVLN